MSSTRRSGLRFGRDPAAGQLAAAGLVGGGVPFFPHSERRVDLEVVETRTFSSRVNYLRYRVARQPPGPRAGARPARTP